MILLLWRLSRPVRPAILLAACGQLGVTACHVGLALSLAWALAQLFAGAAVGTLVIVLAAFIGLTLLRVALMAVAETLAMRTAALARQHLRAPLLGQVLRVAADSASGRDSAGLSTIVVQNVEALSAYYSRYVPTVIAAAVGGSAILVLMARYDARSALVAALGALMLPFADRLWLRWRRPSAGTLFGSMGRFSAHLLDSLRGITTLKAFNAQHRRREALGRQAADLRRQAVEVLYAILMRNGVTGVLSLGGVALVTALSVQRVAGGELTVFALLAVMLLAREAFRTLEKLDKTFHMAWAGSSAAQPIIDLIDARPPVPEPDIAAPLPDNHRVVFDNVTFTWPGSAEPALKNLSFTLAPGECVAVVGPSGAGKSTLASLMMRFICPQEGRITLGGTHLNALRAADLHQCVSGVFQHSVLLHGSIEDNLRMGSAQADAPALDQACQLASLAPWLASLEKGLDTQVGEAGNQLSGGQRQRVAIARAWLKGAPVLVLDEATANVDVASEQQITEAIDHLRGRRSMLVIAHRLDTVRHADRILVLQDGQLAECGDHHSLLAEGGLYARLWALQHAHQTQPRKVGARV